jgi:glucosamine--fructose-6-phosphate aminotransferase (isomerizing)
MCGIVGYVGKENAASILIEGLSKLEYRGYDSAGIAVLDNSRDKKKLKSSRRKVVYRRFVR